MVIKPKALVLKADGTNCDEETAFAFSLIGGDSHIVHINELRTNNYKLNDFQILAIPGGFSYGDDVVSGKILAVELTSFFSEELQKFVARKDTLTIGICNGFQVLIRTGLLPFGTIGKMQATLTNNDSGHFECRWINLKIEPKSKCVFLNNSNTSDGGRLILSEVEGEAMTPPRWTNNKIMSFQVAHGEGKFFTKDSVMEKIEKEKLVVFRYVNSLGKPTQKYPDNPNGSLHSIAGICDTTGRIVGLMPHPERFIFREQHPNWRRFKINKPEGLPIFENMIKYVKSA
ncbi:MAG: phosphoribosylformylglycinamidine synthase subunit PurQ [Patescibacteria group bacterium]